MEVDVKKEAIEIYRDIIELKEEVSFVGNLIKAVWAIVSISVSLSFSIFIIFITLYLSCHMFKNNEPVPSYIALAALVFSGLNFIFSQVFPEPILKTYKYRYRVSYEIMNENKVNQLMVAIMNCKEKRIKVTNINISYYKHYMYLEISYEYNPIQLFIHDIHDFFRKI